MNKYSRNQIQEVQFGVNQSYIIIRCVLLCYIHHVESLHGQYCFKDFDVFVKAFAINHVGLEFTASVGMSTYERLKKMKITAEGAFLQQDTQFPSNHLMKYSAVVFLKNLPEMYEDFEHVVHSRYIDIVVAPSNEHVGLEFSQNLNGKFIFEDIDEYITIDIHVYP